MACKQSERCDHADICRYAKSDAYNILGGSCYRPKEPQTNEEWLRRCTTEQLAEWLTFKRKLIRIPETNYEAWLRWLKEEHK